jgi:hypothetical protein
MKFTDKDFYLFQQICDVSGGKRVPCFFTLFGGWVCSAFSMFRRSGLFAGWD